MKTIITIATILLITTMLNAQPDSRDHMRRSRSNTEINSEKHNRNHRHNYSFNTQTNILANLNNLELTFDQKKKIETYMFENRLKIVDLNSEIKKLTLQRNKSLGDADFNNAKKLSDQYHKKQSEIAQVRIKMLENIYSVLSKEQQQQYRELSTARIWDRKQLRNR